MDFKTVHLITGFMRSSRIILMAFLLTLSSCEGYIHLEGHAYDNETKLPIENVQVLLILREKDTIKENRAEYDTVKNIKRIARFVSSKTDTTGFFYVGNILIQGITKFPKSSLVFIKDGYAPLNFQPGGTDRDSLTIFLVKQK